MRSWSSFAHEYSPVTSALTGACQCGQARYEVCGAPLGIYVCHCRECQKQSASAFGISVIVRSADFRLTSGDIGRWSRHADSGRTIVCNFCRTCGTRLWHGDSDAAGAISIKGGSLNAPPDLTGAAHIWTRRKLAGVCIPEGAVQYSGEPPRLSQ